jgi:hypothetical protein
MRSGKGVMKYECCGERYEGEWENDKRESYGVLYFGTCGLESFRGTWSNDEKVTGTYHNCQGNVVCSFKDGKVSYEEMVIF